MSTILLVEDETAIADAAAYALETEGFHVRRTGLGRDGVAALRDDPSVVLVILDVGLPDGNGFEFCKAMRTFSSAPIVFLTARSAEVDRIVGLEIGGDDYVSKPFSPRELAARVKAILRRIPSADRVAAACLDDCFAVDTVRARISYCGQVLSLTRYEYLILTTMLAQPERVFSRGQLMDQVWPEPDGSLERAVDTHIKSLRAKLRAVSPERDPITTHRGIGYSITGPVRAL
jgi:two-component system catabolic regulation response regulator CreB